MTLKYKEHGPEFDAFLPWFVTGVRTRAFVSDNSLKQVFSLCSSCLNRIIVIYITESSLQLNQIYGATTIVIIPPAIVVGSLVCSRRFPHLSVKTFFYQQLSEAELRSNYDNITALVSREGRIF